MRHNRTCCGREQRALISISLSLQLDGEFQQESGLLAVTNMGMLLANLRGLSIVPRRRIG